MSSRRYGARSAWRAGYDAWKTTPPDTPPGSRGVTADGVRIDDADTWIVDDGGGADVYRGETTASAVAEAWVASGHRAVAVLGRPLLRVNGCVEVEVASC